VKPSWLRACANAVLALSAADALFSLVDEAVRAATGAQGLAAPRNALAQLALCAVAATVPGMLVTPRLPIAVFLPLAAITFWLTAGAAPLPLWIDSDRSLPATGAAIQLGAVALAFALVRARNGGRAWWFDAASPERPAFTWRHSIAFGAALCSLGPLAAVGYGAIALATEIQVISHGFIQVGPHGVSLADRHYQRGDREIRLVGMMHIGDPDEYRALTRTFARESTIVLAEGVSDRERRLATPLQYGHAAQALGLAPQQDLSSYLVDSDSAEAEGAEWPVVRRADLDASSFSPATIAMIQWAGEVWAAKDVQSALRLILRGAREQGPDQRQAFFADVVDRRNEHLVGEIQNALPEYEHVVVPWGALHLPGIERTVLAWGFTESARELHPLFAWRTVADALW
jgi:hypothetical protein